MKIIILIQPIQYKYIVYLIMKPLVIILSQTRAHELTFDNFKKNVIDEIDADLCICIGAKANYDYENPYYKLAKYRFIYDESNDPVFFNALDFAFSNTKTDKYEKYENTNVIANNIITENMILIGEYENLDNFDFNEQKENELVYYHSDYTDKNLAKKLYAINNSDRSNFNRDNNITTFKKKLHYSEFTNIKNRIAFENNDPNTFSDFSISTFIHVFFLWFFQYNLLTSDILENYDKFIITRSDYIYTLPHPKMHLLSDNYVWIPDGEHYDGMCDRHVILPKKFLIKYVNILESFFRKSNEYYNDLSKIKDYCMEKILKYHLEKNNIIKDIRYIPYIFYTVRNPNGEVRWRQGKFIPKLGYNIKYMTEYKQATNYQKGVKNNNIDNFYYIMINRINKLKKLSI